MHKKKLLILFFVFFTYTYTFSQDSISVQKYNKEYFEFGFSITSFFSPKVFGDDMIIKNGKSKLSFGGNFIINYHFNKNFGITSGLGLLRWENSFDNIYNNNYDTTNFLIYGVKFNLPINFLWNIFWERKFNYFFNIGLTPSYIQASTAYQAGSNNWLKPSAASCSNASFAYNLNIGLKYHLYKDINSTIILSYNYYHKPYLLSLIGNGMKAKNEFFTLNVGFLF